VDVGAAGGPVVGAGPGADPVLGVEDDDLAPGPRPLTDGLADDEVLLDRAGALDRLLVRADELDERGDVRLLGGTARPPLREPQRDDGEETGLRGLVGHRTSLRPRGRYSGALRRAFASLARWAFGPKSRPSCSIRSRAKVRRGPACHVSSKSRLALARASGERSDSSAAS